MVPLTNFGPAHCAGPIFSGTRALAIDEDLGLQARFRPEPSASRRDGVGQGRLPRHISGAMRAPSFIKMHGLGNDFVIIDTRTEPVALESEDLRAIAARRTGIGCDQLILLEPARRGDADIFMRIVNADGGEVGACGNATRCVAALMMRERCTRAVRIETVSGILEASESESGAGRIAVDMGPARLGWQDIPLAEAQDTLHVALALGPLRDPACTSMGNPHATFFVEDAEAIDLPAWGPLLEHHPLFPERANIGVAQLLSGEGDDGSPARLRLRVWERGAGLTSACGTGACAALVAAHRRGLCGRRAVLLLDGGEIEIEWLENGHVVMTGPVATSFSGHIDPSLLRG
jgi:diaminopimelate epimerase